MPQTIYYGRKNIPVTIQPNIGLDTATCHSVVVLLNLLLVDESVLMSITQHAGEPGNSDLAIIYTNQRQQIMEIAQEMAERVSILGGVSSKNAQVLIHNSRLDGNLAAPASFMSVLASYEAFIRFLREDTQKCSEIYEDQGTFAMLVTMLRKHEKMAWFLRSQIDLKQFEREKLG